LGENSPANAAADARARAAAAANRPIYFDPGARAERARRQPTAAIAAAKAVMMPASATNPAVPATVELLDFLS
jgi:hypothetical protein